MPMYEPSVGSAEAPKPQDNYDPANPYGQWLEASPPKSEEDPDEGDGHQSSRKQKEDDDEEFADDALHDADSDFEIKKIEATSLKKEGDEDGDDHVDAEVVVFKSKKSSKTRNARTKESRDINE